MLVYQRVWGLKHIETIQVYHGFRVEQWIDRSDTGKMELLWGTNFDPSWIQFQVWVFLLWEIIYIYICVILWSLMIFDDASQPRTFQSLRCPVLAKRLPLLDEIGWSADWMKDQLYPIGIPRIWGWSISLMVNEGKVRAQPHLCM